MQTVRRPLNTFAISIAFLLCFAACSPAFVSPTNSSSPGNATQLRSSDLHPFDVNAYGLNKLVCDPMGSDINPGVYDGLIAQLYYLDSSQPRYNRVADYIEHGHASDQKLFFSDLNIPTRRFETGFPTETGGMVKDDEGNELLEYFALRFRSVLQLTDDDEPGEYEMALLSDDGSVMRVTKENGQVITVVDNDFNHPTRMGCGETLSFDRNTFYDVEIDYFQGPRFHIAMIPMWRKVTPQTQPEPECGQLGNSRYFDYRNDHKPRAPYLDMLARGWRPIQADNWSLPYMAQYNPCHQGLVPEISNFQVVDQGDGSALVSWQTDIPATTQVLIRDADDNETLTTSDNVLRKDHQVVIRDEVQVGFSYTYQGISISEDMGKGFSEPKDLRLLILSL